MLYLCFFNGRYIRSWINSLLWQAKTNCHTVNSNVLKGKRIAVVINQLRTFPFDEGYSLCHFDKILQKLYAGAEPMVKSLCVRFRCHPFTRVLFNKMCAACTHVLHMNRLGYDETKIHVNSVNSKCFNLSI